MKSSTTRNARILKGTLFGLCMAFVMSACASGSEEGSAGPVVTAVETLDDGTVVMQYEGGNDDAAQTPASEDTDSAEKRNCSYIQYCKDPSTHRIICRQRDCGCTTQQAADECFRDAKAVCGNSLVMTAYLCGGD